MSHPTQIFVSHVATESPVAIALKEVIEERFGSSAGGPSVSAFVSSDGKSIPDGEEWLASIKSALHKSRVLLVLCSQDSLSRPWIPFEAGAGWIKQGVRTIPVCHTDLIVDALPLPLSALQARELGSRSQLEALLASIGHALDRPPTQDTGSSWATVAAALREHRAANRRRALRSTLGTLLLYAAAALLAGAYAAVLAVSGREPAGALLRWGSLPVAAVFASVYRVTKGPQPFGVYLMAYTVLVMVSGLLSIAAYAAIVREPLGGYFSSQGPELVTFLVLSALGVMLGALFGSWLDSVAGASTAIGRWLLRRRPSLKPDQAHVT